MYPAQPDPPPSASALKSGGRRQAIMQGLAWTGALQVFLAATNFFTMIVLVRLLSPLEYGRVAAVNGITAFINCFSCTYFIAHAIQLQDGEEPDWKSHWNAGFYIQLALFVACNAAAAACWLQEDYRSIAPLLSVASIGYLFDLPNQIGLTRLRRDLNYRALRIVQGACAAISLIGSIGLAALGTGAFAMIIGYNILHGMPQGFYLLVIERWRPPESWWRWPSWRLYAAPLRMGAQLSGSALLAAARGTVEAIVLPTTVGYEALGLLNRAQVLFSTTVGRLTSLVLDTIYPLLPRSRSSPADFNRHATLLLRSMLLVSIPGAVFVGMEGSNLSRLLYGAKWAEADPLIWPGTLFAWGIGTVLVLTAIVQAQNRFALVVVSSTTAAVLSLPAMFSAAFDQRVVTYAWLLGFGQCGAVLVMGVIVSRTLGHLGVVLGAFVPPSTATVVAAVVLWTFRTNAAAPWPLPLRISLDAIAFFTALIIILRAVFPTSLRAILRALPFASTLLKVLRL
jgi:O-antigen/teichoic acid export membrane protein